LIKRREKHFVTQKTVHSERVGLNNRTDDFSANESGFKQDNSRFQPQNFEFRKRQTSVMENRINPFKPSKTGNY
jgi:hypothetical protein